MLALSRKKGESIIINENIEVTIIEINNNIVKIGINAPANIPIHRKEIYQLIENENKNAIKTTEDNVSALRNLVNNR